MKLFATKWHLTPPAGLDPDHQAVYDRLSGLSGPDFDKANMTGMAEDHHKALDAFSPVYFTDWSAISVERLYSSLSSQERCSVVRTID
jgi:hypothetical protein